MVRVRTSNVVGLEDNKMVKKTEETKEETLVEEIELPVLQDLTCALCGSPTKEGVCTDYHRIKCKNAQR